MIHVGIVEDQTLVREGLDRMLQITPDIRIIAHAKNGYEGLALLQQHEIDLMLLDLRMPQMDGLGLLQRLQNVKDMPPVIILTTFDDDEEILSAIRLGAKGYLMKDVSFVTLTDAIRTVAAGGTLLQPSMTQRISERLHTRPPNSDDGNAKLTDREMQVLRLIFAGFSNGEIAYALRVSEGTVKNHVSSILLKLSARDRIHAVLRAIDSGYL